MCCHLSYMSASLNNPAQGLELRYLQKAIFKRLQACAAHACHDVRGVNKQKTKTTTWRRSATTHRRQTNVPNWVRRKKKQAEGRVREFGGWRRACSASIKAARSSHSVVHCCSTQSLNSTFWKPILSPFSTSSLRPIMYFPSAVRLQMASSSRGSHCHETMRLVFRVLF